MSATVIVCPGCRQPVQDVRDAPKAWREDWYTCPGCDTQTVRALLVPERRLSVVRGGSVAAGIGRNPLGTNAAASSPDPVTVGTYSMAKGNTLALILRFDGIGGDIDGVTFGGTALTRAASLISAGGIQLDIWLLQNSAVASGALVVSCAVLTTLPAWEAIVSEITLAAAVSLDRTKTAQGSGAAPSTGATAATTQARELLLAAINWETAPVSGSWGSGFAPGQNASVDNVTTSTEEGFRVVSSTGAYIANKTGATNTNWIAVVVTLKER